MGNDQESTAQLDNNDFIHPLLLREQQQVRRQNPAAKGKVKHLSPQQ